MNRELQQLGLERINVKKTQLDKEKCDSQVHFSNEITSSSLRADLFELNKTEEDIRKEIKETEKSIEQLKM